MLLLTGATGFIGSKLLKRLLQESYDVCCIRRKTSNIARVKEEYGQCVWIFNEEESMEAVFRDYPIDGVIHCATEYGKEQNDSLKVYQANLFFPYTLFEYARRYHCRFFMNTDTFFEKEIQGLQDIHQAVYQHEYVKSKAVFKHLVLDMIAKTPFPFINLQLEHVYGAGDSKKKFVGYILESFLNQIPYIDLTAGTQYRDWIYVDDVVEAYMTVLKHIDSFQEACFYHAEVGTGRATSVRNFVELAKELSHSDTVCNFGVKAMNDNELMYSCADNRMLLDLGWNPQFDLQKGINQMIRENKYGNNLSGDTYL